MSIQLSIIIVSFNTSKYTLECLTSVHKSIRAGSLEQKTEVILVDNASKDQTINLTLKKFPNVTIIRNRKNEGYARANNQGMKRAKGEFILLLNSDTVVSQNTLSIVLSQMREDSAIGVLGCRIHNNDGSLQPSFGYLPQLPNIAAWMIFLDDIPLMRRIIKPYHANHPVFYKIESNVGWVTGAFFLVRHSVVNLTGDLDEKVFMYGEEVEWCYRIHKAGFRIFYTPHTVIKHYKGGSSIGSDAGIVEEYKAIIYLFTTYKPKWETFVLRMLLTIGALLRIVLFGIIGRYEKRISFYKKALLVAWG